jgi:hypothetical protein
MPAIAQHEPHVKQQAMYQVHINEDVLKEKMYDDWNDDALPLHPWSKQIHGMDNHNWPSWPSPQPTDVPKPGEEALEPGVTSGPGTCLTPNLNSKTAQKWQGAKRRDALTADKYMDWCMEAWHFGLRPWKTSKIQRKLAAFTQY